MYFKKETDPEQCVFAGGSAAAAAAAGSAAAAAAGIMTSPSLISICNFRHLT